MDEDTIYGFPCLNSLHPSMQIKSGLEFYAGTPMRLEDDGTLAPCIEHDFFAITYDSAKNMLKNDQFQKCYIGKVKFNDYQTPELLRITVGIGRSIWMISDKLVEGKLKTGDLIAVKNGKFIKGDRSYFVGKVLCPNKKEASTGQEMYQFLIYEFPHEEV